MNTQTDIQPQAFLDTLFEIDQISAVRVASKWGGGENVTPEQYQAACSIIGRQTVFPTCPDCEWPIVDEEHMRCDYFIDEEDTRTDDDVDEGISPTEVYHRAYRHFGNHEMAREAAEQYPGDFM